MRKRFCAGCLASLIPCRTLSGQVFHEDYANHIDRKTGGYPYVSSVTSAYQGANTISPYYRPFDGTIWPNNTFDSCWGYPFAMRPFLIDYDTQTEYWMPGNLTMSHATMYYNNKTFLDYVFYLTRTYPARHPTVKTFHKFIQRNRKKYPKSYDNNED
jgi:hypothetical protein